MASMGLDHPSDIKWRRRCASEGMIDAELCEGGAPPKWRSSLALFTYTPDDEYQVYDGREIVYLKISATLTGYQPEVDEIEGEIEWDEFNAATQEAFQELLDSYRKCTGGLLQVTVGPDDEDEWDADSYPYIADYEPKRRALYTMATETNSRMSRTLEQTQVRKAAATTESNEILDVDLGGSRSFGGNVAAEGPSGSKSSVGGSYSQSNRQRVGSRQMNQENQERVRSSSRSQEQREGYSHTTQLTQLHHLLDSYHKGTNRALFYFLPRPYVKEEPTGFVPGPRGIEGVQEIFLVVNKPKEMDEIAVSARLDTGHYGETKHYKYDSTLANIQGPEIDLPPPSKHTPDKVKVGENTENAYLFPARGYGKTGEAQYNVYQLHDSETIQWRPENHGYSDYVIDARGGSANYSISKSTKGPGSNVDVDISTEGNYVEIRAEAYSEAEILDSTNLGAAEDKFPDVKNQTPGYAAASVEISLRSRDKKDLDRVTKNMLITTRGLCCGEDDDMYVVPDNTPVRRVDFDEELERYRARQIDEITLESDEEDEEEEDIGEPTAEDVSRSESGRGDRPTATAQKERPAARARGAAAEHLTIHEANHLGTAVTREALGRTATNSNRSRPRSVMEADHTVAEMATAMREDPARKRRLREPAASVDSELTRALAEAFEELDGLTRLEVVDTDTAELERVTGLDRETVNRGKLAMLGVPLKDTRSVASREDDDRDPGEQQSEMDNSDGSNDEGGDEPDVSVDVEVDLDDDDDPDIDIEAEADFDDEDQGSDPGAKR